LVLAALLLFGAVALGASRRSLSTVVYPPQVLPLSFSHARHQGRAAMPCVRCHPAATTSLVARDDLMPTQAACEPCHIIDLQQAPAKAAGPGDQQAPGQGGGACALCHPGWDGQGQPPRLVVPEAALRFNHALHADQKISCERCHGSMATVGMATRADLPSMAECQSCHEAKGLSSRCATCHPSEPSGRLTTALPAGQLVPADHGPDFATRHGRQAQLGGACDSCHGNAFCVGCHDGKLEPLATHPGDYARLHAVDARKDTRACAGCHRIETFCTGCHARTGVMPDKRTSTFPTRRLGAPAGSARFHPPGWSTGTARGGRTTQHHAFAAQRNLAACASCHREDFCIGCHRSSGAVGRDGISPHGPAWRGSARCRAIRQKNSRVCLRCHLDDRSCDL
jgi:hypothetical protein